MGQYNYKCVIEAQLVSALIFLSEDQYIQGLDFILLGSNSTCLVFLKMEFVLGNKVDSKCFPVFTPVLSLIDGNWLILAIIDHFENEQL